MSELEITGLASVVSHVTNPRPRLYTAHTSGDVDVRVHVLIARTVWPLAMDVIVTSLPTQKNTATSNSSDWDSGNLTP